MAATGIAVSPMHHPTLLVPLVFAIELDRIAHLQPFQTLRQVDVVRHKQGQSRLQAQDETLMSAAFVVIAQDFHNYARACNLIAAGPLGKCAINSGLRRWLRNGLLQNRNACRFWWRGIPLTQHANQTDGSDQQQKQDVFGVQMMFSPSLKQFDSGTFSHVWLAKLVMFGHCPAE